MNAVDMVRALAALAITLGLLFAAAWLARRYGLMQATPGAPARGQRRLRLLEQLWIDPGRTRLLLVQVDRDEHLLVVGPSGASAVPLSRAAGTDQPVIAETAP